MSFDRLFESACCPPPGDALLAIASEFRSVDADRASFRLDDFARSLFAVAAERDPGSAARALAALLTDEVRMRRDESSLEGLWIDQALERRAGHPLALAVVAAEIGRRAGLKVGICSTAWGWYAGIGEPERLWLIDPAANPSPPTPRPRGPCAATAVTRWRSRRSPASTPGWSATATGPPRTTPSSSAAACRSRAISPRLDARAGVAQLVEQRPCKS